jgi:RNA polymerase sigma-70 factor (ECF subfamily)
MGCGPTAVPASNEQLARRAQQGCSESFEELVRRFQVPLLQFLRRWSTVEDAEDLVQEAFLRAYQNLAGYRPAWRFSTWLFTIARRANINWQRKRRPQVHGEALESVQAETPPPWQRMIERENRGRLWDLAEAELTEPQFTATWLFYVEEMPVKQISRVVGRSRVAVRTMLFRARQRLLFHLKRSETDGSAEAAGDPPATPPRQSTMEYTNG